MARVTVEDCLKHVENRFALVLKAAKRAHQIELGAVEPMVPLDNDKPTVLALREIAQGLDVTASNDGAETGDSELVGQASEQVEEDSMSVVSTAEADKGTEANSKES